MLSEINNAAIEKIATNATEYVLNKCVEIEEEVFIRFNLHKYYLMLVTPEPMLDENDFKVSCEKFNEITINGRLPLLVKDRSGKEIFTMPKMIPDLNIDIDGLTMVSGHATSKHSNNPIEVQKELNRSMAYVNNIGTELGASAVDKNLVVFKTVINNLSRYAGSPENQDLFRNTYIGEMEKFLGIEKPKEDVVVDKVKNRIDDGFSF